MAIELSNILLGELIASGLKRNLTIFAGAGISAAPPTNLPLARGMTHAIVGGLCGQRTGKENNSFWMAVDRLRPERLLSILHEVMGEEAFTPLRLLGGAEPNRNHRMLASLAAADCLAAIITTNFDTAIEQALTQARIPFALLVLETEFSAWGGQPSPLPLLKLHGALPFARHGGGPLDAMMEQVGRPLPRAKAEALVRLIQTTDLVVVGYSGRDDFDIYPLLYETKSDHDCIWIAHPVAKPPVRRRVSGDEAAHLNYDDFLALFAESVVADPVERLVAAQPHRVHRVVMDAGKMLDELCWQLSYETFPAAEEEQKPTLWEKKVTAWAERFRGTEVPARLAERIKAEGAAAATRESVISSAASAPKSIAELEATLRQQIDRGDVVNQSGTLLALANAYDLAGQPAAAVDHWVACLAILSKTHQLGKVRMRTVVDTPQEFTQPMAREAMGRLLGHLASKTGWPLAKPALATLERHLEATDIRRYLRSHIFSALQSIDAAEIDDATCEWLGWVIETLSVIDEPVAIPAGIDPENPEHHGELRELMAEHTLKVGRPIWQRLIALLETVDSARPSLVLDFVTRWGTGPHLDEPLLPWFTALWLGLGEIELEERLDRLESLATHSNLGVQEAAAYSLRVLSHRHAGAVLMRLTRLAAHDDECVRGNVALALAEMAKTRRRESLALLKVLRRDRSRRVRSLAAEGQRRIRGPLWRRLLGLNR